jgi:DNA-binding NarL/FixJ family response regulator
MRIRDGAQRPTPAKKIRVLLVDDHPVMRAGVAALFGAEHDLELIGQAEDGLQGVSMAGELQPDVVIMDVALPGLDGAAATKQIKGTQPELPVLALSAHEEPDFARRLLAAGANGYALKRSACDELVRAVRLVAAGNTYVDPSLADALVERSERRRSPAGGMPTVTLSDREAEVIRLIAQGHTSKEMAMALSLSPRTLETYKARAMSKLNLRSRADLFRYAMRAGWLRDA